jgi:hypothetical protein
MVANLLIDVNRQLVIEGGYTASIINLFGNAAVVHVAIPVIYNICADYGMSIGDQRKTAELIMNRTRTCPGRR